MAAESFVQCRVTTATKRALRAVAARQQLTESALMKRLIEFAVQGVDTGATGITTAVPVACDARLYVRLRPADKRLLKERAEARDLASATYVSLLIRAHLNGVTPIPKEELTALKRCIAELAAIGRNVNQVARVAQRNGQVTGPHRSEVMAMIQVCTTMHSRFKELLKANLASWESGDAGPQ